MHKLGAHVGEYVLRQLRVLRELQNIPILIFASPKTMPRTSVTKFRLAGLTSSYEVVHFYINTLAGESDSRDPLIRCEGSIVGSRSFRNVSLFYIISIIKAFSDSDY